MPKIHRLPPELANQIAAGEVVERPASVVKELVENAVDAGATRIAVTIAMGGKTLVRVEDDGEGMDRADALLALERHATSKINRASDLGAIHTLGFRGEALPSIASVSRLLLRTRLRGVTTGTEIRVVAGVTAWVRDIGMAEGTSIEVADLFENLPARRKFLKSDVAEAAQVSRVMTQLALAYPEIGFTLVSAQRTVLQVPPVETIADRLFQLYGERADLQPVQKEAGGLTVAGFVAKLAEQGPVRGPQHVFVNRRIVKDRTIAHAIQAAYSSATVKERSPEVHLFLELAADRVDVNVHPTKAEVRFLDQSLVHEVLRRALVEALGQQTTPELQLASPRSAASEPPSPSLPGVLAGFVPFGRWTLGGGHLGAAGRTEEALPSGSARLPDTLPPHATPLAPPEPRITVDAVRPMIPLGQFRDTYIVAVDDEGIAIIDQHVAHERVLFEQVMEKLVDGRLASQGLLAPVLIEVAPGQREALALHRAELDRLGFELDAFGGSTVRVTAVPALVPIEAAAATLRALAADLEELETGGGVEAALRRIAATVACHAAVKANYPLTAEKMRYILDELRRTAYSSVCPHGRPVVLRLTRREIERNFQRI